MVFLTFTAASITADSTKKAPKLAATACPQFVKAYAVILAPKKEAPKIKIATPKLAPELIPKTNGPANGFLNNVCINNPLIDNPEPTTMAVIALGNLKSVTITSQVVFSMVPKRLLKILWIGILTEPKLIFTKKQNNNTTMSSIN